MNRFQRGRQALALLVAVVLVSGFILYRTGVIGPLYMSSSKSTFMFVGSSAAPPTGPIEPAPPPREAPAIPPARP